MGPLVMTGLGALATAPAIGWISASTWRPAEPPARGVPSGRSLAIVSMAFCEGLALLGFVVGFNAVFIDGPTAGADALAVVLGAASGAIVGLALTLRDRATGDPTITVVATAYILGLAVLGIVTAYLASVVTPAATAHEVTGPFPVLGLVLAVAVLGVGLTSARAIRSMRYADPETAASISSRQVTRSAVFELIGVASFVIAIFLVMR